MFEKLRKFFGGDPVRNMTQEELDAAVMEIRDRNFREYDSFRTEKVRLVVERSLELDRRNQEMTAPVNQKIQDLVNERSRVLEENDASVGFIEDEGNETRNFYEQVIEHYKPLIQNARRQIGEIKKQNAEEILGPVQVSSREEILAKRKEFLEKTAQELDPLLANTVELNGKNQLERFAWLVNTLEDLYPKTFFERHGLLSREEVELFSS